MLKIDVLALGMLTCIRKGFELLRAHYGVAFELATIPAEDAAVYEMLCRADSIGVFQVESRAQMSMLPRLKPRTFYDLVIEVAIVRPGPIQGDMVHPYLRRRDGMEPVEFPSDELRGGAGQDPGRAAVPGAGDEDRHRRRRLHAGRGRPALRRSMATFRRSGQIERYRDKLVEGMVARGYDARLRRGLLPQIEGFGYYGFPESHAASFALLVYVSAWLKCHYPDVFCAAILNCPADGLLRPGPARARRASTTASRCARSTSTTATGTARWSRASAAGP